ncbi:zinc finger protein 346-like isoform X12 [Anthonomus grandis grandis]|uniref:zinc finger protein 346-like isoform X12 n=1 Tax=Anthonomus grandis grandis TaxID=2921223 RepID=UPI00216510B2|nr:zinc finger protein 346-like isoform X12 [Anthonomus grandis grandis]
MPGTEDGEFYPANPLERNYKIPKKATAEISGGNQAAVPVVDVKHFKSFQMAPSVNTPLAASYYNYPYDPNSASAYYNYYNNYTTGTQQGMNVDPPLPPNGITTVEGLKRNIFETYNSIKEKPKTYGLGGKTMLEQTVPDLLDDTLPKDLKILFQPLFCKLCELQLSSNQTAKMHYKSKNHEKKIRKWLTEYAEKTGEPLHHRATTRGQDKKKTNKEDAEKNPSWFHCDICDLDLTGRMHAESHYMGRNHQKALLGHKNPAGNGYYDADGKWIRIKSHKSKSYDFEKGEDNFGLAFKPDGDPAARISDEPPSKKKKKDPVNPKEFHCEVCNINTTCQEQLNTHFMGQKHVKKLKQLGLENHTTKRKSIEESVLVADFPTIPSVVALELNINVAAHRTPSGDYYCPTCNLSLNSEVQFLQHMKSKGHGKKLAQKKKDDAPPAAIITSPIVTIENDTSSLVNISEPVTK